MSPSSRISARRISAGLAIAALAVFWWLAHNVSNGALNTWDDQVRIRIHAHASPALTTFLRALTELGEVTFLVPLCFAVAIVLERYRRRYAAVHFAIAAAGAEALDQLLKYSFHRMRPTGFFGITSPANFSFPSGHAMTSIVIYGALAAVIAESLPRRSARIALWIGAALFIGSIGFTRVYLGVHWPSDVLGGFAAGLTWLLALEAVRRPRTSP